MESLTICPNVDRTGQWSDVAPEEVIEPKSLAIGSLEAGTVEGRASVGIRMDLPDGSTVIGQTTLRLFVNAARALEAAHGNPG